MNIDAAKKLKAFADENKIPYIVTFDNEHHMYGNSSKFQIVWDDANEICIQISINQDPNLANSKYPTVGNASGYDQIQHMRLLFDKQSQVKFAKEFMQPLLTEDEYKTLLTELADTAARTISPLHSNDPARQERFKNNITV